VAILLAKSSFNCAGIIVVCRAIHVDKFILILEKINIRQIPAGNNRAIQTIFLTWFTLAAKNLNPHK
jgi:hypothetical protein